jgi:hypothetical protein
MPFSRLKCAAILLVASIFVAACAFFASHPEGHARYAPTFVRIVCGIGIPFFGAIAIMSVVRLVGSRPALVIDRQGIDDRSNLTSIGRVDWADVRSLRIMKARWNNGLVVELRDPERFARRGNVLQRLLRLGSPSPVVLGSNALAVSFDTMVEMVSHFQDEWKARTKPPLSPGPPGV